MKFNLYRLIIVLSFLLHGLTLNWAYAGDLPKLPKPYVSRGLRAVVMPIDQAVRTAFNLSTRARRGVVVVSVEPNGLAAREGFVPGDVIDRVHDRKFRSPIEMDEILAYWAKNNRPEAKISYYRAGKRQYKQSKVAWDLFSLAVDLATVGRWTSWTSGYGFSYADYYAYNSSYVTQSYSSSWTTISTTIESKSFQEEYADDDMDDDGTPDTQDIDDDNDGIPDGEDTDEGNDGIDDAAEEDQDYDGTPDADDNDDDNDGTTDEQDIDDDGDGIDDADEESDTADAGDDNGEDGSGEDDGGGDDGGSDDSGGGEEPPAEE